MSGTYLHPIWRQRLTFFANYPYRSAVIGLFNKIQMDIRYTIKKADSPIIALGLHDGHEIAQELQGHLKLKPHEVFREEDPYTGELADLPVNSLVVHTSRFQVDLNRPREQAIYVKPENAWGLDVWDDVVEERYVGPLLEGYDQFYEMVSEWLDWIIQSHGYFLILDIHSYNHRRDAPNDTAPEVENPQINIGTAYNHFKWRSLAERFVGYFSHTHISGCRPDVRENVKFKGGGFSQWVNESFGQKGCVLSIEFKKTFMDEWTGRVDIPHLQELKQMMEGCLPLLMDELERYKEEGLV